MICFLDLTYYRTVIASLHSNRWLRSSLQVLSISPSNSLGFLEKTNGRKWSANSRIKETRSNQNLLFRISFSLSSIFQQLTALALSETRKYKISSIRYSKITFKSKISLQLLQDHLRIYTLILFHFNITTLSTRSIRCLIVVYFTHNTK